MKAKPTITVREAYRSRMTLDGADAQALEHALTITERERDDARTVGEFWRASYLEWEYWATDLLTELGRQPLNGRHVDEAAREVIATLARLAPGVPRCENCGCFATRHEVDDEEFRECADCECEQYVSDI